MKRKQVRRIGLGTLPAADCRDGEAVNVRPAGDGAEVVGMPSVIAYITSSDKLLGTDVRGGRHYYFVSRNSRTAVLSGYEEEGRFVAVGQTLFETEGEITGMVSSGDLVVFGCAAGLEYLLHTPAGYEYLGGGIPFPVFSIGAGAHSRITATVSGVELSSNYPQWKGSLCGTDAARMKNAFENAADEIGQTAARDGYCLQTVAVRTALRLWDGSLLWTDEAATAGGIQELSALAEIASDGGQRAVAPSELSADVWKPTLTLVSAGIGKWKPLVKSVEIYAAAVRSAKGVRLRCEERQQGGPAYYLRMTAVADSPLHLRRELAQCTRMRRVATISDIDALLAGELNGEGLARAADMPGAYALDVRFADAPEAEWTPRPPRFSPQVLSSVGTDVFAGNLKIYRPEAPRFLALADAATLKPGMASTFVCVELATEEGKALVVRSELAEMYAGKLNGFVCYPDSRARKITVATVAGGQTAAVEIPLEPTVSGDAAFAVSDDGFPLLPAGTLSVPESQNLYQICPSTLFRSGTGNPLQWQGCGDVSGTVITAVAPSFRYGSSWVFGRSPVCLFSTDGLRLLSFDSNRRCTASTLISRRTAERADSVVPTAGGLAFVDKHGELCRYCGTSVKPAGVIEEGVSGVGYSERYDEVWIAGAERVTAVCGDGSVYHRPMKLSGLANTTCGTVACSQTTLYAVDRETEKRMDVVLRTRQIPADGLRLKKAVWDVVADYADLRFSVYGENGRSCHGELLSQLDVSGTIGAPLHHRMNAPSVRTLRLSVSGMLPSGVRIYPAELHYAAD